MLLKIKKRNQFVKTPIRASELAAGYDIYALDGPYEIPPKTTVSIETGLAFAIPAGYYLQLCSRSSTTKKYGLRLANGVGVIDADYRGEIQVMLHNDSDNIQIIKEGDRVAQAIVMKHEVLEFEEVDSLDDTVRGAGGFGSTGK